MENVFLLLKEKKVSQKNIILDKESKEIIHFLKDTKEKLEYAELCLNFTNNELLIDSLIYEIMSLKKKFDYYLKLSKEKGIILPTQNILKKFPAS